MAAFTGKIGLDHITLIIPYLSITGDCSVTLLSGVPNRTGGTCPTRTVTLSGPAPGPAPAVPQVTKLLPARVTETGIGDIVVRGRYYLLDEFGMLPTIALIARIKIPTADPDRGLGTGEFDEAIGVEISKQLTETWIAFVDGSYSHLGDPPGVNLRDQWNYGVGLGYYFTETLLGSVFYEYWSPVIGGLQSPQDLLATMDYKVNPAFWLNASAARGLSNGASDWAFSVGLIYRF